jgi:hypothetical protein
VVGEYLGVLILDMAILRSGGVVDISSASFTLRAFASGSPSTGLLFLLPPSLAFSPAFQPARYTIWTICRGVALLRPATEMKLGREHSCPSLALLSIWTVPFISITTSRCAGSTIG